MRAELKDDLLNICGMLFIRQLNDNKVVDPENVIVSLDIFCLLFTLHPALFNVSKTPFKETNKKFKFQRQCNLPIGGHYNARQTMEREVRHHKADM